MYSVSQKKPAAACGFLTFFLQTVENFNSILLLAYSTFMSTLDNKFLFNYLQLLRSYAILSATT